MDSNVVIEREKSEIDKICDKYQYDNNIRHLLYVIIPAFVIRYGVGREKLILNTFRDVRIMVSDQKDDYVKAYYSSRPRFVNGEYQTSKYMVLQNYNGTFLVDLLDNLVHEFNHAVNSYFNEVKVSKNYLYLRTGLTYRIYRREDLTFVKKAKSFLLEEIINTKQTEEIIDIIKAFDGNNPNISNTIYAINSETNHKYSSNSYYLEGYVCRKILENRTFLHTLANLRLSGEVYDIDEWFDRITGEEGSYKTFIQLLNEVYQLEMEYSKKKFFRGFVLSRIRDTSSHIMRIIDKFDQNVNYR